MISPRPRSFIVRPAAPPRRSTPRTMRSIATSCTVMSSAVSGVWMPLPALFTRMSTGAASSSSRRATRRVSAWSVKSASTVSTAMRCAARSSSATSSRRCRLRATSTRSQPRAARAREKARPIPEVPPVTIAVPMIAAAAVPLRALIGVLNL